MVLLIFLHKEKKNSNHWRDALKNEFTGGGDRYFDCLGSSGSVVNAPEDYQGYFKSYRNISALV